MDLRAVRDGLIGGGFATAERIRDAMDAALPLYTFVPFVFLWLSPGWATG